MKQELILSKATANVIHDKRHIKKDGTYPLKLRVIFERKSFDFGMGIDLTSEEFENLHNTRQKNERIRRSKLIVNEVERRASETIDYLHGQFSIKKFKDICFGTTSKTMSTDVYHTIKAYATRLSENEQYTTATGYLTTLNSLLKFKKKLSFEELDVDLLKAYDKFLKQSGCSDTTISIYMRRIRTLSNEAISNGVMKRENYPFGKGRYLVPASRNIKKALTITQIEMIFKYPTILNSAEDKAKDLWIFSYLCNGLNIKDICRLTTENVGKNSISVIRAKTERTARANQSAIIIKPPVEAFSIMNKWRSRSQRNDSLIFPFLINANSAKDERIAVQNVTRLVNKYMKRIGSALGFEMPLTTYVARHSYSTVLKRSNVPVEYISESLGHKNRKTTDFYLDSFEEDDSEKYGRLLLNFVKPNKLVPIEKSGLSNI